jgi:hypothetical protein
MGRNLLGYDTAVFASLLYPFTNNRANDVYHLAAAVLVVVGAVALARKWWRSLLAAFVVSYAALLLPVDVHELRYVWPFFPLFAYCALYGATLLITRLRPTMDQERASRVALAGATAIGLIGMVTLARMPLPRSLLGEPDVRTLFAEIRMRGQREPIRVVFMNPRVLTLETGVPAMPLFGRPVDVTIAELRAKRMTHAILGDMGTQQWTEEHFETLVREQPSLFREEYRNPSFVLYRIVWPDSGGTSTPGAARPPSP